MANIAELYRRWTLDCVVEAALAVAQDLPKRPQTYRHNPDNPRDTFDLLVKLGSPVGKVVVHLNVAQRSIICSNLLGASDSKPGADKSSPFQQAAASLRDAAVAYSERKVDTGELMLSGAFVDAAKSFKTILKQLEGVVLDLGEEQIVVMFDQATKILKDAEIAQAFDGLQSPGGNWPLGGNQDGKGAILIEQIVKRLQVANLGNTTQQYFLVLQRVAEYGGMTIEEILGDYHVDNNLNHLKQLIQNAFNWAKALRALSK